MHCTSCNKLLTDYESTRKNAVTGKYFDLCKVCFEDIKPFVKVLDRKDLISEADLDEHEDLEDVDMDTQSSLEDYEDIIDTIENYRDYDEH
jgi:hypothetical protein